ncbi:nitrous oxide reductase accessory protein NosL [Sulfurimonas autotrophica]|uniref:NosL family protein n=1 Tax=Sulfurimonas autotrophica (strain ATCC BAA-671 / DSM 16294 / JCM 11897 / OK10) TaxID=563040 RepID=E0URD6_SULAO|nr:nitrous oxide reductase accessory protein NosL [Sulfurimonas autotrophica]ADN10022.1 conserved hypothetical protein [Sulfurimonas autotrophica DSM 16294]
MGKIFVALLVFSSLVFSHEINFDRNSTGMVRHLKVYKNPSWVSEIILADGKRVLFSSPKGMFEFYFHPAGWYSLFHLKSESDFKTIYVTDFKTLKAINAKGAFYVYGSDITSPGGDDLVPFNSYKDATEFSKKHHGSRVLGFKEVNYGLIKLLNGAI